GTLDAMRLNWGPYLWMRCYTNGAQFLDRVVGARPDWERLEQEGRACPPGAGGVAVLPFVFAEPALGISAPRLEWFPAESAERGLAGEFTVADAVAVLVKFRDPVAPNPAWREAYREGLRAFEARLVG